MSLGHVVLNIYMYSYKILITECLEEVLDSTDDEEGFLSLDTVNEIKLYLEQIDAKLVSAMHQCRDRMQTIETEKQEINRKIYKL